MPEEETSLTRLLRSLLQDIPPSLSSGSSSFIPESTPEFVPIRTTPPSRPMVIGSGKDDSSEWEEQDETSTSKSGTPPMGKPSKPVDIPAKPVVTAPAAPQKPAEKAPDKPAKVEKQLEKPAPPKKEPRTPQGFDHIFQLTQGNLENSGLVIFNGATGSGRTTLCSGLIGNYLKMGNPCLYLTYDEAPTSVRDQMKKLGTDATQYESQFRFILIDGFAAQSETFSLEMNYLDQPFSFDNIQDTLTRNAGIFAGDKIRIVIDSLDKLAGKVPQKDFTKSFTDLAGKLKDSGATFIVTVDLLALPKDLAGSLMNMADCVVDLGKDADDPNGRQLQVQRLNQKSSKTEPETFEIDSNKGLVFV
ncbi:MAG TPA: ATPase domain-containing protein [Candidatus Bathyarchaeia archaeon]|nr:ATPase domain-containing protein [Candidatus Bathyarchaeia archaeon]